MSSSGRVGDFVTLVRGKTYKGALVGADGPALLGLGSITPGGGFRNDYKTYGGECPPELMLVPGDLFVSLKGATKDGEMIGSIARLPKSVPSGRLTQDTVRLVFHERGEAFERYLYWLLRTPDYRSYCAGRATGSAVVAMSRDDFLNYPVPPLTPIRHQITTILERIDEKIESNRRIASISSDLVDILAVSFLDKVPRKSVSLSKVVDFNQATIKPGATQALDYIDIAAVVPGRIERTQRLSWDAAPSRARRRVADGDVIFSTVRPGRRSFALIIDPPETAVVSTGFAVMTPTPRIGSSLLTSVAASTEFSDYLESVAHGSAYPAVSVKAMGEFEVEVPAALDDAIRFENVTMPLRRRAAQAESESHRLEKLRNALLPELLAGRLRVSHEEAKQHG